MKTINLKNAFKLSLFVLILLSAKTFSHPNLTNDNNPKECESKMGCGEQMIKPKTTKMNSASRAHAMSFTSETSSSNCEVTSKFGDCR